MEDYEAAKLRMQCLQLAHASSMIPGSSIYSIVDEAKKYWAFVNDFEEAVTAARTSDNPDIPF
jgi:hypothetical protein